jgi:hypothetical protein
MDCESGMVGREVRPAPKVSVSRLKVKLRSNPATLGDCFALLAMTTLSPAKPNHYFQPHFDVGLPIKRRSLSRLALAEIS